MKINFALVGLAAAQSGEGKDYEYDYPAASEDRWEFSNGVTFTDFSGKNTGYITSSNFVKALKLSCWNSNMIRDMNNDNKFQRYTFTSGTPFQEQNSSGWKYALGDLSTGMNHQYGFESDGHMNDEFSGTNANRHGTGINIDASDTTYGQRFDNDEFNKWGYNHDGQNRAESIGYDANAIAYHFGHSDNHHNGANRPYSWDSEDSDDMPEDFAGYKDDWRFSLRMGGCLYETTGWTYDEDSFKKVGRLTYTGDNNFFSNIFASQTTQQSPTAGSYFADVHWVHVFNAHIFPHRPTGYITGDSSTNQDSIQSITGIPKNGYDKTSRDIEDFNVVMANPTYEGHGFLNFVATYHDHVDTTLAGNGYAGYRFYSTINGYNNVDSPSATSCADLTAARTDSPGRTDARCGSAIYDNFGDWYLRPPQKYERSGDAQPYWSYIMPHNFSSSDNLWTPSSGRDDEVTGFRGFAISSFPHNELGQDFRFNIRTLHNMGMGVAKTDQMHTNRSATAGIIHRDQAIWSYYMYAVDTIKIAFPEYVARVNHCHFKSHKTHPNCESAATTPGWQDIIVDGVTMKSFSNPSTSSDTRFNGETNQYGFNKIMGQDDHTKATLHYEDDDFASFDASLDSAGNGEGRSFCANGSKTVRDIRYQNTPQGVSEHNKPFKPCASWCHPGAWRGTSNTSPNDDASRVCGRVLKIEGLLQTYDELHLRQYGTIQEVWVQLMYAYQEGFDQGKVTGDKGSTKGAESPFPNIFFSAPEVVTIKATCPNSNFKCRGYMTDENQPYAGARENNNRVYNNNGSHSIGAGEVELHADSVYPANEDDFVAGK